MLVERAHDGTRGFVDVIVSAVEFLVGDRARRRAHRLAVHVAHDREQGTRPAVDLADEIALRRDGGALEFDDADVIGSALPRDPLEQFRRDWDVLNVLAAARAHRLDRGVIVQAHGSLSIK
ncbi:hypothetical protein [Bradyrhizobium sp. JR3.5]